MKKKKKSISKFLLPAFFLIGLSLVLYPSLSNYINSIHQTREIASYSEAVDSLDKETCKKLFQEAKEYNESLLKRDNSFTLTNEQKKLYPKMLKITDTGTLGYIEIPSIDVRLPIYHGTSDAVLQRAVGHMDWTSLPVGGKGTHSVLSGHRGLPTSKLFTDLNKLAEGDIFMLRVLDKTLTYEVDQIKIVMPEDVTDLGIEEGKDLCTLVTCTPYGINTHRLLVRGHRVKNRDEAKNVSITSEAVQIEPMVVAPFFALPLLIILFVYVMLSGRGRKTSYQGIDKWNMDLTKQKE